MDDNCGGVAGTTGQGRTLPPERPGMARPHAVRLITQPQRGPLIDGLHQAKPPNGGVPSPPYAGPSILSPSQRARYCIVSSGRGGTDLIPLSPKTEKQKKKQKKTGRCRIQRGTRSLAKDLLCWD